MSRPQVTITLGRSGQVIKRPEDSTNFDSNPASANKRSIKDRLGTKYDTLYGSQSKNKRMRGENNMWDPDFEKTISNIKRDDLRFKLIHKSITRQAPRMGGECEIDLREKLSRTYQSSFRYGDTQPRMSESKSLDFTRPIPTTRGADNLLHTDVTSKSHSGWTLDGLRYRSPDRILSSSRRVVSPAIHMDRVHNTPAVRSTTSRPPNLFLAKSIGDGLRPIPSISQTNVVPIEPAKAGPRIQQPTRVPAEPAKPIMGIPPPNVTAQKTSYAAEESITVAGLLNSLGLGKYSILFQAEEVICHNLLCNPFAVCCVCKLACELKCQKKTDTDALLMEFLKLYWD